MPHPCPHLQAALTRGGLLRDVRHDAEGSQLPRVISHRPIIGVSHPPGNRKQPPRARRSSSRLDTRIMYP